MERRINKQVDDYLLKFKDDIKTQIGLLNINDTDKMNQLLQYIYDYERLTLDSDSFLKRKRVKNMVMLSDRCCAKRANGEQCTRRRQDDTTPYCGTHIKGAPYGICEDIQKKQDGQQIEVWAQDIQGIIYYIDKAYNVYQVEDIMQSKVNPKVIAKCIKIGETYFIPEFTK